MVAISQAEVRRGRLLPPATPEKPGLEELEAAAPPLPIDVPLPPASTPCSKSPPVPASSREQGTVGLWEALSAINTSPQR